MRRIESLCAMVAAAAAIAGADPATAKADHPACDAIQVGVCNCDVTTLHPLQGAVGQEEVNSKAEKIKNKFSKQLAKLEHDPIKVVRGPAGGLYITDHHHGAAAWRQANPPTHPLAICQIAERPAFATPEEFWAGLVRDHLIHLEDADGKPITPAQLPVDLAHMANDPYRSLAWRIRDNQGFCRTGMQQVEFAEFVWADWLRTRPELPLATIKTSTAAALPAALTLVHSPAAKDVPGYLPEGSKCDDPVDP